MQNFTWKLGFDRSVAGGKKEKEKQVKSYQSKVPKDEMLWKKSRAAKVLPAAVGPGSAVRPRGVPPGSLQGWSRRQDQGCPVALWGEVCDCSGLEHLPLHRCRESNPCCQRLLSTHCNLQDWRIYDPSFLILFNKCTPGAEGMQKKTIRFFHLEISGRNLIPRQCKFIRSIS